MAESVLYDAKQLFGEANAKRRAKDIIDDDDKPAVTEEEILEEAKELFNIVVEHEMDNRQEYDDDVRFARLSDQWPERIRMQREEQGRPVLTVNRIPTFLRQVINDARQNKPGIHVHAADSKSDPLTAEVFSGLIRNIEYSSPADVAYDTALDCACTGGFGYWRINTRYTHDDTFEQDIIIEAVPNPLSIYADPYSTCHDSSDWNTAFVVDLVAKRRFKQLYKKAEPVDWDVLDGYTVLSTPWIEDEMVRTCEYWRREEITRQIVALDNGEIVALDLYLKEKARYDSQGVNVVGMPRDVPAFKVCQYLMTGAEILKKVEWAGSYIPIVPVYGDEVNVGGERHFRSLVRDLKDPQRMFNYWRTMSTELIALAPKAPFIGPKGAFDSDQSKWETANLEAHAFLEYDGDTAPQRQAFAGVPAGVLQEALNAADDLKAVTGIHDASLGARGNETSGKAIIARQREGDTATFHYIDNLSRAIRHTGRILIELIPKVYSTERIIRVLGPDREAVAVPINQPTTIMTPQGEIPHTFDLTVGKYDLTVTSGPSFTTRREEAANQMLELIRAYPNAAMVLGDLLAKNLDWPGADEVAKRLNILLPPAIREMEGDTGADQQIPPQVQAQLEQAKQIVQKLEQENQQLQQKLQVATGRVEVEQGRIVAQAQTAQAKIASTAQIEAARIAAENQRAQARIEADMRMAQEKTQADHARIAVQARTHQDKFAADRQIADRASDIDQFEADTDRMKTRWDMAHPPKPAGPPAKKK